MKDKHANYQYTNTTIYKRRQLFPSNHKLLPHPPHNNYLFPSPSQTPSAKEYKKLGTKSYSAPK